MALVKEGYESAFEAKERSALALTDLIIQNPAPPDPELVAALKSEFSDAELVEISLAVALFLGMSKVLITLGLEPESMSTTIMPTPGSV